MYETPGSQNWDVFPKIENPCGKIHLNKIQWNIGCHF